MVEGQQAGVGDLAKAKKEKGREGWKVVVKEKVAAEEGLPGKF